MLCFFMTISAQFTGDKIFSAVWLCSEDPYACCKRFFADSRAGKTVNVYDMVTWEVDYLRLLFPPMRWNWADNSDKLAALAPDVVVVNSNTFTINGDMFRDWVPRILVYLSDEWGCTPGLHMHTANIPLVLRQYNHSHYVRASNVRQIPLGFINTMFDDPLAIPGFPSAADRQYRWCFAGKIKGDRMKAVQAFESWGPCFREQRPPHELARAYQDSVFTLCPRGNVMMDCFRIYEATLCGSIPVLAGCSKREFRESFSYANAPPWIYARTWRRARMICEDLEKTGGIKDLQTACLDWWNEEIETVKEAIFDALKSFPRKGSPAAVSSAPPGAVLRWKLLPLMMEGRNFLTRKIKPFLSK
jgi:hypothetical protein